MKKFLFVLLFLIVLLSPAVARPDCTDLGYSTAWVLQEDGSVIFYYGHRILARVVIADCTVEPTSIILLLKNFVCDMDHIEVDGEICTIMTVQGGY